MKKARKHEEPSAESLREMPEIDFSRVTVRRNPYYERILKTGIRLPGRGRPRKGTETGPTVPRSIRFPLSVWKQLEQRAKADGLTLHAAVRAAIARWMAEGTAR
jgi:hypothetical protein